MIGLTPADLASLENQVAHALRTRDHSDLAILGFGEISIALGCPTGDPTHVCKRTPPLSAAQFERYGLLVDRYIAELRADGISVVDTEVLAVDRGDRSIGYIVQPLVAAETLGHNVLAAAEPDSEHPLLLAIADSLAVVSSSLSVDAQVTNWSWDGAKLTLLDVGTPFLWDGDRMLLDMSPYLPMIPAPLRSAVRKDLTKLAGRWRAPRGVAIDVVANLYREGLDDWVAPMVLALNRAIPGDPIDVEQADAAYRVDVKTWPRLTRLKRLERAWQTRVRRRPYDFFIQSTFGQDETY